MKFDVFFSICQSLVDGLIPTEQVMFSQFFDQVKLADQLGFETAWIAESHFSVQVQKQHAQPVVPHFQGEIGLNPDIFQLAHRIFASTNNINVGSAIMNLLCNGGPITKAESAKYFMALHSMDPAETRRLKLGFAAGRFPYQISPFGVNPRDAFEQLVWHPLKGKVFIQATEIFLRLLKGEVISSDDVYQITLQASDFRQPAEWQAALQSYQQTYGKAVEQDQIAVPTFWQFDPLAIVPQHSDLSLLDLVIGSHDPSVQKMANKILPCSVFNLSITSPEVIEKTHQNMQQWYHPDGGPWLRDMMPRTAMVFINNDADASEAEKNQRAHQAAEKALRAYWLAMEGTIDDSKISSAVDNSLCGSPKVIIEQMQSRFHPDDRVMLWFDFNNHDNDDVKYRMALMAEHVLPSLKS